MKECWHKVFIVDNNNSTSCVLRQVYVVNNKITEYALDYNDYRTITSSTPITDCVAVITIKEYGEKPLTVIFLEDIYKK
ncbi:hypothetical protein D0T56_14140 [Dysgonomonas sp. 520]|nr:hypothetical protein [Dysgonomonas sp. 520]